MRILVLKYETCIAQFHCFVVICHPSIIHLKTRKSKHVKLKYSTCKFYFLFLLHSAYQERICSKVPLLHKNQLLANCTTSHSSKYTVLKVTRLTTSGAIKNLGHISWGCSAETSWKITFYWPKLSKIPPVQNPSTAAHWSVTAGASNRSGGNSSRWRSRLAFPWVWVNDSQFSHSA